MIESESKTPSQFVIGNCLSCHNVVKVPTNASPDQKAKCPSCQTIFLLREILEQAVPTLEIIDDEDDVPQETNSEPIPIVDQIKDYSNVADGKPREKFVVPNQLAAGAKRKRRRRSSGESKSGRPSESRSGRSSESGQERSNPSRSGSPRSDSVSRRPSSRPVAKASPATAPRADRQPRSTGFEMLKVVFGSLIALPIAYSILFYVFNRDPLNVAPMLSNVSPSLVPAAFHDSSDEEPRTDESASPISSTELDDLGFSDGSDEDTVPGLNLGLDENFGL